MRKYGPLISDIRRSVSGVRVLEGVHMSEHTSFRIGGEAPVMFVPEEPEALAELCSALYDRGVRPMITGNGTNLLFAKDYPGVVIKPRAESIPAANAMVFRAWATVCGARKKPWKRARFTPRLAPHSPPIPGTERRSAA